MRIAITGGTGFVGRNLARMLLEDGHEVVLVARGVDAGGRDLLASPRARFAASDLGDIGPLADAFAGCAAVAHLAGINCERGRQSFHRVHVEGTRRVVEAARRAGAGRIVLLSFLRARPDTLWPYHRTKWEAEEAVRGSGLDWTVLKAGVIYGRGDHMLDHLSAGIRAVPLFPLVGLEERSFRPAAVEDVALLIRAALVEGRLSRRTVRVVGPEELTLREGIRRVARALGRRIILVRMPVSMQLLLAWAQERFLAAPLASVAQVRMLSEGLMEAAPPCEDPPEDLRPRTPFSEESIRRGLPPPRRLGLRDLRCLSFEGTAGPDRLRTR